MLYPFQVTITIPGVAGKPPIVTDWKGPAEDALIAEKSAWAHHCKQKGFVDAALGKTVIKQIPCPKCSGTPLIKYRTTIYGAHDSETFRVGECPLCGVTVWTEE